MALVLVRLAAAIAVGLGAWCSLGVLATGAAGGRLGLLPPVWMLAVVTGLVAGGLTVARASAATVRPLFAALIFALPWLPGPTVTPFLLLSGPVVLMWWALILVATLVASGRVVSGAVRTTLRDPRRAPWIAGFVVFVVGSAAAVHLQDWLPGGDEPHYLVIAQSLWKDRDLRIENNHTRGDYLEYYSGELRPDYLRRGTDRQIYSIHAPGLGLLVAPALAVGGYPGVVVLLLGVGAAGAGLAWWLGFLLTGDPRAAWVGWAVVATSITFVAHTFMVFPDGPSGVAVLVGLWVVLRASQFSVRRLVVLSSVVAFLPWLHTRNAPMALVLGVAAAWPLVRRHRFAALVAWMGPLTASALAWLASFKAIYGVFDPAAPYGGYTQSSAANLASGLVGLFFDQQFGAFAYAPALGIGLVGLGLMLIPRHASRLVAPHGAAGPRALALVLLLVVAPYVALSASYAMWWGGASAPARFLTPIVLPLSLPAAALWCAASTRASRAVMVGLVVVSAVLLTGTLIPDRGLFTFNGRDGFSLLADWAAPVGDLARALPALHRDALPVAARQAALWAILPLVGAVVAGRIATAWSRGATALLLLVTGVATMLAVSATAWRIAGVSGQRPDASQVRLVGALARALPGAVSVAYAGAPRPRPGAGVESSTVRVGARDLLARIEFSTSLRRAPRDTAFGAGPLPAGLYRVIATTHEASSGDLEVVLGRGGSPLLGLPWDRAEGAAVASGDVRLALPIGLVTLRGAESALSAVTSVRVQPQRLFRDDGLAAEPVERLATSGPTRVYVLTKAVYVERDGMWLRPGHVTPLVVAPNLPDPGPLNVRIQNGPIPNVVELVGRARRQLVMNPGDELVVPLDVTWVEGAARITVRAESGFRPFEIDRSSADRRLLGAWVTFP